MIAEVHASGDELASVPDLVWLAGVVLFVAFIVVMIVLAVYLIVRWVKR